VTAYDDTSASKQPTECWGSQRRHTFPDSLGGAKTVSPGPSIKEEAQQDDITTANEYDPGTYVRTGSGGSANTKTKLSTTGGIAKSVSTRKPKRSGSWAKSCPLRTFPPGIDLCQSCIDFDKGATSRCEGSADPTQKCLRYPSARKAAKASLLALAAEASIKGEKSEE